MKKLTKNEALLYLEIIKKSMNDDFLIKEVLCYSKSKKKIEKSKNIEQDFKSILNHIIHPKTFSGVGAYLQFIPKELHDEELLVYAIKTNSNNFKVIEKPSKKLCEFLVDNDPSDISQLKPSQVSKKIALKFSETYKEYLNKDQYELVEQYPELTENFIGLNILVHLPFDRINSKIVLETIKKDIYVNFKRLSFVINENLIKSIIKILKTNEQLYKNSDSLPFCIGDIPLEYHSKDLYLIFAKTNGSNIEYFNPDLLDQEIIDACMYSNAAYINKVPDKFLKRKHVEILFEKGRNISVFTDKDKNASKKLKSLVTKEDLIKEINKNPYSIERFSDDMLDDELKQLAVSLKVDSIRNIKNYSFDLYLQAISKDKRLKKCNTEYFNKVSDNIDLHINNFKKQKEILKSL